MSPALPGLGATVFTANPMIPNGLAVVAKNHDVVWFGPLHTLPLNEMPAQSRIHVSPKDYGRIAGKMKEIVPSAPEVISLKR